MLRHDGSRTGTEADQQQREQALIGEITFRPGRVRMLAEESQTKETKGFLPLQLVLRIRFYNVYVGSAAKGTRAACIASHHPLRLCFWNTRLLGVIAPASI